MKTCTKCGELKSLSEYYNRKKAKDGKNSHCKSCEHAEIYAWRKANPDKQKAIMRRCKIKKAYGMSDEDYEEMYDKQKGCCALCDRRRAVLVIDHDHETKRVRGLLCTYCNHRVIGQHTLEHFQKCVEYMKSEEAV